MTLLKIAVLPLMIAPLMLASCGVSPNSSQGMSNSLIAFEQPEEARQGIVDGTPTAGYPATYFLLSLDWQGQVLETCTGTFVGDNVLVTAAHCIPAAGAHALASVSNSGSIRKDPNILQQAKRGVQVFMDESIRMTEHGPDLDHTPMGKDFAVVLFPSGTSRDWTPLARRTAPAGTPVTLVGYGANDSSDTGGDQSPTVPKKMGVNKVAQVDKNYPWEGLYQVHAWAHPGEARRHGSSVSGAAPGDSGGPLLMGATMIGIVKYGFTVDEFPDVLRRTGTTALDFWVDVSNPTAQHVLSKAAAAGAHLHYAD